MATWEQIYFQNRSSPIIEQFIFLHDYITIILIIIISLVTYIIYFIGRTSYISLKQKDNHELEVLWTFLPGIILIFIAFPSLRLLYITEENKEPSINLKTIGHQWYWSYEYSDFNNIEFDSFMLPYEKNSQFRLLDVDNHTTIPEKTPIQLFVSSADVLHSWTIPNLGIKADSTPGRLNTINILRIKPGLFYGQCSEICGTNHRFMPIVLNRQPILLFKKWINSIN
jgi:cytochrome c oxidase subunit 2